MKLGIMQPYIFPYVGYFQLINLVDKFIIYDDVNYIKKGWVNRNKILNNGTELYFSIPIKKVSQNKLINEHLLGDDYDYWKKKFLNSLNFSYKNSPNFESSYNLISRILNYETIDLVKLLEFSILETCEFLEISTNIHTSSEAKYDNSNLKSSDRILDISKKEKTSEYVNLIGGINLYDKNEFKKNNIELKFIKTLNFKYYQLSKDFHENLSIIDIIMNCNKEEIKNILLLYKLE
jgi:hypothetical protein